MLEDTDERLLDRARAGDTRALEELIERLPPELRDGPDGLLLDGELAVSELVDAAERLLLSRLSGALGEESSR